MNIFFNKLDNPIRVGSIILNEKDLKSEVEFIEAIQKEAKRFDNGTYTIHHNRNLFARFDIMDRQLVSLHKWSKITGVLMPCWNYFKQS